MSFNTKMILGMGAFVVVALGLLFLWPNPDAAELEDLVREFAEMAGRGDVDGCMAYVYENYDANGEDYEAVERKAKRYIGNPQFRKFALSDIGAEVSGDDGRVQFTVTFQMEFQGSSIDHPVDVLLSFRRLDGKWKIISYDVTGGGRFPF